MSSQFLEFVLVFGRRRGISLAPDWAAGAPEDLSFDDQSSMSRLCETLGWTLRPITRRPKAQAFPLVVWDAEFGWGLAEQWSNDTQIRVLSMHGTKEVEWGGPAELYAVDFPKSATGGPAVRAIQIFWSAIMRRKGSLIDATIATVVINVIALVTSIYSMQVYDRVIPRAGFATLAVLTGGMVFAVFVDMLIRNVRAMMIDREAGDIDAEVSEFFYSRMQAVRLDARPKSIGTMAAQLRGTDQVRSMLSAASLFVLADLPFAIIFIFVMMMLGGIVAIVPLIAFPLSLVLAYLMARFIRSDTNAAQVSANRKNGLLVESLDAAETIKANQGGWHMLATWNSLVDEVHTHDLKVKRWSTYSGTGFGVIQQLAYVGVVCVGAFEVASGNMTMGGVVACSILSGRVNGPLIASLPNLIVQWGYARSSLQALDGILTMPSDQPLDRKQVRLAEPSGTVQIENAKFIHAGSRSGVMVPRLAIAPGERIGIIGPIGSGKSTFLRLLSGLYAPQEGHVLLDGVDVRQIDEADLRRHVCYFPQDYRLINGTLRDNLTLGISPPTDDRLLEVATQTGLIQLVKGHPMGFDLPISEGGMGLSGGQRTLVGLSRMMLSSSRLYLLDEPTANLDQETEAKLLRSMVDNLDPKASLVMITHKMQLLNFVNRIIVIAGGQVALDGPTQTVIAQLGGARK